MARKGASMCGAPCAFSALTAGLQLVPCLPCRYTAWSFCMPASPCGTLPTAWLC